MPPMYTSPQKRTEKSARSMRRSLAHSDADVAELSNRQSARSALDRQRLASSVSEILSARAHLRAWYNEKTWPTMLKAQCGVWDYQVVERSTRRNQNKTLMPATQTESKDSSKDSSIDSPTDLLHDSSQDLLKDASSVAVHSGAAHSSPPLLVRQLVQHEEHLFSRRRRFFEVSVVPPNYTKQSYASFSAHRQKDEEEADLKMAERKRKLKELSQGIAGAINLQAGNNINDDGNDNEDQEDLPSISDPQRDGWEREDDEWDKAAKISEARARTSVLPGLSNHNNTTNRTNSSNSSDTPLSKRTTTVSENNENDDEYQVLFRDDRCASVVPHLPEPIEGTLILTTKALIFEPRMNTGDREDRALYDARSIRSPISQFRRIYLRSYCLVDNSFEILLTGGRSAFYHFCVSEKSVHTSNKNSNKNSNNNKEDSNDNSYKRKKESNSSASKQRRDALVSLLLKKVPRKVKSWSQLPGQSSRRYFEASQICKAWQDRALSNFDYLMALNTMAGRTHNDLSQYPVFPWILTQFDSPTIDLTDPKNYRDLRKPVGALNSKRLEEFRER